jgi:hypothetical protein
MQRGHKSVYVAYIDPMILAGRQRAPRQRVNIGTLAPDEQDSFSRLDAAIDHMLHEVCITQIARQKIISLCLAEPRELEIDTSDPEPFSLPSSHEIDDR